jgi:glycosyltransferase involved in cell wall biosynthesis
LNAFDRRNPSGERQLRALAKCDGPIIVAAGRLSPEKGFHVLVDAARLVVEQIPNARFVLFGDGPERSRLLTCIRQFELHDNFLLAGFRGDLDTLLPWADVVAISSFTEGLPNVALEACAAGVPVVATAVGGIPEVINDGETGLLVRPGDSPALAQRIVDCLECPELSRAIGISARRRMREEFSFASQARAYETMFAELPERPARTDLARRKACA